MRLLATVLSILYLAYATAASEVDKYLSLWPVYNGTLSQHVQNAYYLIMPAISGGNIPNFLEKYQYAVDMFTVLAQRSSEVTPERLAVDRKTWLSNMANSLNPFTAVRLYAAYFDSSDIASLQKLFLQQANAYILIADAWSYEYCDPSSYLRYFNEASTYFVSISSQFGITTDGSVTGYDQICSITRTTITTSSSTSTRVLPSGDITFDGGITDESIPPPPSRTSTTSSTSELSSSLSSSSESSSYNSTSIEPTFDTSLTSLTSFTSSSSSFSSLTNSSTTSTTFNSTSFEPSITSTTVNSTSFEPSITSTTVNSTSFEPSITLITSNSSSNPFSTTFSNSSVTSIESSSSEPSIQSSRSSTRDGENASTTSSQHSSFSNSSLEPSMTTSESSSSDSSIKSSRDSTLDGEDTSTISSLDPSSRGKSSDAGFPASRSSSPTTSASSTGSLHRSSEISGSPASRSSTVLTTTVTAYTTYCPEPTTFCAAHTCYTVTEATRITVTNCPCVLKSTVGVSSPGQLLCNGGSCFPIILATASSGPSSGSSSGSGRMVITKSSANNAKNNDMSRMFRALAAILMI